MYCTNCGVQQSPGANFCQSCGHRLKAAEAPTPAPPPVPIAVAPAKASAIPSKASPAKPSSSTNPQRPLGTKWLIYWAYIHLPFTGIIGIGIGAFLATQIAWLGAIVIAICAPYLAASIGIYKRKIWGWWLNWLTIALSSVNGLIPNSYETIGDPVTSQVAGEFAIRLLFVSIIWILPNIIYWRKRRHLFS